MGAFRGPDGQIVYLPDDQAGHAEVSGFTPVSQGEAGGQQSAITPEDNGALGGINAAATGTLSGLTLGLSDVVLKGVLNKGQGDRLAADRETHSVASGVGQLAGALLPSIAAPGSLLARAPAGYLARAGAEASTAARAAGGVSGAVGSLAVSGLEGSIQNAGIYLSDTALGDRELTAEGMAGALGTGFGFGVGGGVVAHGIEAGTIAARRMFARVAEGGDKAAQLAEAEWTRKSQEILEANEQTAEIARAKLAQARSAREQAGLLRDRAAVTLADARAAGPGIDAARARATSLEDAISKIEASEAPAPIDGDDSAALAALARRAEQPAEEVALANLEPAATGAADESDLAALIEQYTTAKSEFDAMRSRVESASDVAVDRKQAVKDWIESVRSKQAGYRERTPLGEGDAGLPRGREWEFRGTPAERDAADKAMLERYASSRTVAQKIADGEKVKLLPTTTAQDIEDISALQTQERAAVRQRSLGEIASGEPNASELPPEDGSIVSAPNSAAVKPATEAFEAPPGKRVVEGLPERKAIKQSEVYSVPIADIRDKIIAPPGAGEDLARMQSIRSAFAEGKKLPPVRLYMLPDGQLVVDDGRHRLLAAIEDNRDVLIRMGRAPQKAEYGTVPLGSPADTLPVGAGRRSAAAQRIWDAEHTAQSTLESQLAEMQKRISGGATLEELGTERMAHPLSPRQLEMAHDDAIERAANATDSSVRQQNLREAAATEEQLQSAAARPGAVEDVAAMAELTTKLERAAAHMVEAVGDVASPAARDAAAAFREAEAAAERKTMARVSRAVDGAVETTVSLGPDGKPIQVGIDRRLGPTSEAQIAAARTDKLAADAALARAKAAETEAGIGARAAKQAAKDARTDAVRPMPESTEPAGKSKLGSAVGTIGTVLETAGSFGVPGIPKPSDIPVVGPLLGAYLKYRALKATVGRFAGRIPATAETKAAALAAQTKDKIARAVDRSLGLLEQSAPKIRAGAVAASVRVGNALQRRAIDDGHPDATKGASLQSVAAVRIREVANAAANPQLILAMVQKETQNIVDPDLISAIEQHQIALYKHLNDTAPKAPPPNPYSQREWEPSMTATMQWGRRLAVANDPVAAFEALHQQSLTPEAADTLRVAWPKLFALAQQRLVSRAGDLSDPVPYRQRLQNSLLFDVPLDASLDPDSAKLLRSVHVPSPSSVQSTPTPPPTPSIAGSANLSALYQPGPDRRSQMR